MAEAACRIRGRGARGSRHRHYPKLPRLASKLPHEIAVDPSLAGPLSGDPVSRAFALVRTPAAVYVLGDDARLRRLDLLGPNAGFGTTVLKPDGKQAAFPQRDSVVLVDLTTAAARRHDR